MVSVLYVSASHPLPPYVLPQFYSYDQILRHKTPHDEKPLFLYLAHQAVHDPLGIPPDGEKKSCRKKKTSHHTSIRICFSCFVFRQKKKSHFFSSFFFYVFFHIFLLFGSARCRTLTTRFSFIFSWPTRPYTAPLSFFPWEKSSYSCTSTSLYAQVLSSMFSIFIISVFFRSTRHSPHDFFIIISVFVLGAVDTHRTTFSFHFFDVFFLEKFF